MLGRFMLKRQKPTDPRIYDLGARLDAARSEIADLRGALKIKDEIIEAKGETIASLRAQLQQARKAAGLRP